MNRSLPAIFLALAVAAGVFAYVQFDSAAALKREIAENTSSREAAQKAVLAAEAEIARLKSETESTRENIAREAAQKAVLAAEAEITRLKSETESTRENIARLTAERDAALAHAKNSAPGAAPMPMPGTPPPAGEKAGNPIIEMAGKMFESEEGKKMMRSQMAMGLKMQYGGLARELKLDPKVADQVMSLLGDRQMALSEATFASMKNGTLDEAATQEIGTKSDALQKDYDAKLKAILGEQGAAQLKDYERTLGDRMMLTMHEQQFTAAGAPLEQAQRDGLLQIMKDERLKTPATPFDSANSGDSSKALAAMRDDAAVEKWLKQEDDYQQRVLQAATKALNPDQVNALRDSFKQQLDMQKFGMKMGKEMFGGTTSSATISVSATSDVAAPEPPVKAPPAK